MSDIIDFNKIKNKATDKDLLKFEDYIYQLYYKLGEGKINFVELNIKIKQYMEDNNISQEKFNDIQNKLLQKYKDEYGIDFNNLGDQMEDLGIDLSKLGIPKEALDYESLRKNLSFNEKYNNKIGQSLFKAYLIKNETNDLSILLKDDSVIIKSEKVINLKDNELNEFLVSYKKTLDNKPLNIELCEYVKKYEY
ncbi:MAG: DUF3867 domain-containing protein [Bacillota bacterium]|nr:DUF3867 domain-containing protein [Bacillota bacterium]